MPNFQMCSEEKPVRDCAASLVGAFFLGLLLGSGLCAWAPAPDLNRMIAALLSSPSSLFAQVLTGLCPLLLAAGLCALSHRVSVLSLIPASCGFLCGFTMSALLLSLGLAGWMAGIVLLSGRWLCLGPLFWFLLRRCGGTEPWLWDLLLACLVSACCIVCSSRLILPILEELDWSHILF